MKKRVGDLFIQILTVMVGVFLGFIVSNWSDTSKEKSKAAILLNNITAEISENKNNVAKVLAYHRMVRDSTRYYMEQESIKKFKPEFFKGVNTVTFANSAFETGVQTGLINEISISTIQNLNDVYAKQRSYEDFSNLLLGGLISLDFEETEKATRKIVMYLSIAMTDIVIKEEQLLDSYNRALKAIKR